MAKDSEQSVDTKRKSARSRKYREFIYGRSARFPSVEERVRIYMSNWFVPSCGDEQNVTIAFQMIPGQVGSKSVLVWRQNGNLTRKNAVEIESNIVTDRLMMVRKFAVPKRSQHRGYQADVMETIGPLVNSLEGKPLLTQWRDSRGYGLPQNPHLALPHFKKFRPVLSKDELEKIKRENCTGNSSHRSGPILWKLDSNRLQGKVKLLHTQDKPWNAKRPKAVFRGGLTGHRICADRRKIGRHRLPKMSDVEICNAYVRCQFVLNHFKSSLVDARLTGLDNWPLNDTAPGLNLLKDEKSLQELLDYKMIIMLEGNDVSSCLRWALRSNSIVMMPPPKFTSWWMEELLQPWVHYVPLNPSLNDT
ncbi:hypothetical protein ACHAWF_014445 [Thalassiosira exigua]